jgi:hypothetical protein
MRELPYEEAALRTMPYLLSVLVALTLVAPSAMASPGSGASACGGCCVSSPSGSCASVCAPGAPVAQTDEQSSNKPLGAWCIGVLPAAFIAAVSSSSWAMAPASPSFGPPRYLSFGRFLL